MLNIQKLKEFQLDLNERTSREFAKRVEKGVIQFVRSEVFTKSFRENKSRVNTEQSARVLNNWESEGIIDKINHKESKFRTYNKSQAIWLSVVTFLRDFGLSIEKIKLIRKELFTKGQLDFCVWDFALMRSILEDAMILVVYTEGNLSILSQSQYADIIANQPIAPHLHFNLQNLAAKEFPYNNFITLGKSVKSQNLSPNEISLLYYIRTGDFESILVKIEDADPIFIEGSRKIPMKSKIADIINRGGFQKIEIKIQKGEVVHISNKEQIKLTAQR